MDNRGVGPDSLIARFDLRWGARRRNRYRRNRDERLGIDVAHCDEFHRQYDRFANKDVQVGELPDWTHVRGTVAWFVAQGPYAEMQGMWRAFHAKVRTKKLTVHGPPGDVYVCDPDDHAGERQRTLSTVLWIPVKG